MDAKDQFFPLIIVVNNKQSYRRYSLTHSICPSRTPDDQDDHDDTLSTASANNSTKYSHVYYLSVEQSWNIVRE